jgi:2-keto-4-pentenoate hydratase
MTSQRLIHTIARGLVQARRSGVPWQPDAFDDTLDAHGAYQVQDAVAAELGWFAGSRPVVWKAGGPPAASGAPLPRVWPSGSPWNDWRPRELIVEAEVALRLGRTPASAADAADCVATMCVSIELVGTRLVNGLQAPAAWKLADQGVHELLVAGAEVPYAPRDWARQACHVRINGAARATVAGTHPNGDVMLPLAGLVSLARERGLSLRAGDLVTTGAWWAEPVQPGDVIEVVFEGIGSARFG